MTSTDGDDDKPRKERSPSFPFISLGKAVDRARAVADAHKRSPTRPATVGETWGYAPASSGLQQTIAALKAYGLMEDVGRGQDRRVQLTDLAWRILHDSRPGAKEQAVREAALRPRLFAEYAGQWVPERPSDHHCLSELHLDRGFTQQAAELFLRVFDETVSFANLKDGDNLSPSSQGVEIHVPAAEMKMTTSAPGVQARPTLPPLTDEAPYQLSIVGKRLRGTFDLDSAEKADEMVRAINAWKTLLTP